MMIVMMIRMILPTIAQGLLDLKEHYLLIRRGPARRRRDVIIIRWWYSQCRCLFGRVDLAQKESIAAMDCLYNLSCDGILVFARRRLLVVLASLADQSQKSNVSNIIGDWCSA